MYRHVMLFELLGDRNLKSGQVSGTQQWGMIDFLYRALTAGRLWDGMDT